jgi:hypothetical protein
MVGTGVGLILTETLTDQFKNSLSQPNDPAVKRLRI